MQMLRIRNSTNSTSQAGSPKTSLLVKCDCQRSHKDCRPWLSVVLPWQRNSSDSVARFRHPQCAVGRFGKVINSRQALCSYLKLACPLPLIYDTGWRSDPNCAGVIHENCVGRSCEARLRTDLSPTRTLESGEPVFSCCYPNCPLPVSREGEHLTRRKPLFLPVLSHCSILNKTGPSVPVTYPQASIWNGE